MLRHYNVVALPCRVRNPHRKRKVERGVGHAKNSSLKGLRFETLEEAHSEARNSPCLFPIKSDYRTQCSPRCGMLWSDHALHGECSRRVPSTEGPLSGMATIRSERASATLWVHDRCLSACRIPSVQKCKSTRVSTLGTVSIKRWRSRGWNTPSRPNGVMLSGCPQKLLVASVCGLELIMVRNGIVDLDKPVDGPSSTPYQAAQFGNHVGRQQHPP